MPKYRFTAIDIHNRKVKGSFIAVNDDDLKNIASNQNYYLLSYRRIPESSQMFSFLEKIKVEEFTLFCRQFSILISAGVNVDQSVEILRNSVRNKKLKSILEVVLSDLLKGKMLSESFAKYPKTFPVFFRNMIEVGELSGRLDLVFKKLAEYYEKESVTKRKVKNAMSYPLFLVGMLCAALAVISLVVMPTFDNLFRDLGATLPQITITLISVTNFIRANILELLAGGIIFFIVLGLLGKTSLFKKIYDTLKLNVPIIKDIQISLITSRFATSFALLLSSSMGVLEAVKVISRLVGNVVVEEELKVVSKEISSGRSVGASLLTVNRFPKMLVEMIEIGESVGRLEEVLEHTANYYNDEVDVAIKKMTSSIGPIMVMLVALVIVVTLLAIFLPMLDIMNAIDNLEGI